MKREVLYHAISGVSKNFLDEAETYNTTRKIDWKRWIAAAACLVLLMVATLHLLPGNKSVFPFVITAYAVSDDGSITEQELTESIQFPVSLIETKDGVKGFLFSVGENDSEQPASIAVLTAGSYDDSTISDMIEIAGLELKQGRSYVFFVGEVSDFENLTFNHKNDDGTVNVKVTISVKETANGYIAELQQLTSFPVREENR